MTGKAPRGERDSWQDPGSSPEEGTMDPSVPPGAGAAVENLLEEMTNPDPLSPVHGFRNRGAIVTGASTGIGRAVAVALARAGAHVAFNYLDEGEADHREAEQTAATIRQFGVKVYHEPVDSRDSAAVGEFVGRVRARFGGLHILINNAGVGADRALWRMSDEQWRKVIDTNLTGTFHFLRAVAPFLRAQEDGKIVNVSSVHALRSEFGLVNYAASKAGILALTRSAAIELGPSNVNVNAVAPGYIRTPQLMHRVSSEILDQVREQSALGRLGDPQDVAGAVLFLCSEAARHITGVVLPVDGGYLL
jgi:3-oxoacyl-[acyl-carrier protein] reductase